MRRSLTSILRLFAGCTTRKDLLYEVKEAGFRDFTLKQIAMAIKHGRWDQGRVLYHNRPAVSWHPDNMVLTGFRVGEARFTEDEAAGEEW